MKSVDWKQLRFVFKTNKYIVWWWWWMRSTQCFVAATNSRAPKCLSKMKWGKTNVQTRRSPYNPCSMGFQCFAQCERAKHLRCIFGCCCCCCTLRLIFVLSSPFAHMRLCFYCWCWHCYCCRCCLLACWIHLVENQPSDVTVSFKDLVHTLTRIHQSIALLRYWYTNYWN